MALALIGKFLGQQQHRYHNTSHVTMLNILQSYVSIGLKCGTPSFLTLSLFLNETSENTI